MAISDRGTREPPLNHMERSDQVGPIHPLKSLENHPLVPSFLLKNLGILPPITQRLCLRHCGVTAPWGACEGNMVHRAPPTSHTHLQTDTHTHCTDRPPQSHACTHTHRHPTITRTHIQTLIAIPCTRSQIPHNDLYTYIHALVENSQLHTCTHSRTFHVQTHSQIPHNHMHRHIYTPTDTPQLHPHTQTPIYTSCTHIHTHAHTLHNPQHTSVHTHSQAHTHRHYTENAPQRG